MAEGATTARDPLQELLKEHAALVASAVVIVVVALRLLRVAHGDASTAVAIVQMSGTANVVLGLLTPVAFLVVVLAPIAVAIWGERHRRTGWTIGAILAILLFPVVLLVALLVGGLTKSGLDRLALRLRFLPKVEQAERRARWRANAGVWAVLAALGFFVVSDAMWMPIERITFRQQGEVVGYVLSSGDGSTVVLREDDRRVVIVSERWAARSICSRSGTDDTTELRSLPAILLGEDRPSYPECPG